MSAARPSATVAHPKGLVFDIAKVRADFPILTQTVHGKPLVYLDNAATSQKPRSVIDTLVRYYQTENANIHRGVHTLSQMATEEYEAARTAVRRFLNAASDNEIIFVRGATEGINLVASTYGRAKVSAGDEIIISGMEHHSNIVPWQMLCQEKGAKLRVIPITDEGELRMDEFERMLSKRTKLVSIVHISNSLGTINPVEKIIKMAHAQGTPVLVDGAQSAPHLPIDLRKLDPDFFVLSGHKVFGPTGIGVVYGKEKLLEAMPPYQGGGDMIRSVTFEKTTYNDLPFKFEAGTPHIEGVIGLGAAVAYLNGMDRLAALAHENDLLAYSTARLSEIKGLRIIGTAKEKASLVAFVLDGAHPHDIGTILDSEGVAIRTGHHCTMPVMDRFGIPATARASFAFYNTKDEVDALVRGILKAREVLGT